MKTRALILFVLLMAVPVSAGAPALLKDVTVQGIMQLLKPSTWKQQTTPANPASGNNKVYFKNDDKLYTLNSAGLETAVGSGSGSGTGSREYLANTDAEQALTGMNAYQNTAQATPVTGTGGTPTITLTRTNTASEVVRGTWSFKIAKPASNVQGQGFSEDFVIDNQDKTGGPIYLSLDYAAGANYASGDIKLFVVDKDTGTVIPVQDGPGLAGALPSGNTRWTGVFYPAYSTSTNYRLTGHFAGTSALAYNFIYDTLHAGGANLIPGAIVTGIQSYNGTFTGIGSPTIYETSYQRRGRMLKVQFGIQLGTTSATTMSISLPPGLQIDPNGTVVSGRWTSSSSPFAGSIVTSTGTNASLMYFTSDAGSYLTLLNGNTWSAGTFMSGWFEVPIVGWTSGAQISTAEMNMQTPPPLYATSAIKTPTGSGTWSAYTGNALVLPAGRYRLGGDCDFNNNGTTPGYFDLQCAWLAVNGNDTSTISNHILNSTNVPGLTVETPNVVLTRVGQPTAFTGASLHAPDITIRCTQTCTIYLDTYTTMNTPANARLAVYPNATKLPDFTAFGVVPTSMPLVRTFTGSGTYTPTPGTRYFEAELWAAGGGGGSATGGSGTGAAGGGAGGGGYCRKLVANPSGTYAYSIGTGGTSNFGGGNSSLTGVCSATGGSAGSPSGALTGNSTGGNVGPGGGASGGDYNQAGNAGDPGLVVASGGLTMGGRGGGSYGGSGGMMQGYGNSTGKGGVGPGAGGGGGTATTASQVGATGNDGLLIIKETF